MDQALNTLGAVVLGGAVTYVVQVSLEDRRITAAEKAEDRKATHAARVASEILAKEMRVAERLFLNELDTCVVHHDLLLQEKRAEFWLES